ncbi:MAG TPA: phage resistance protein [Streptosporangiaceae bacterium]|nr:phage resistance protein [Streptosporangiaceae bacterium]
MTTLLRDLIEIPDRVLAGDFVLALSKGIGEKSTIEQYVVTEQLAGEFDRALGIIQTAVETSSSRASYLDGSFGSGKSHFMAILYAILRGDPDARGKKGLADVVATHDSWLRGRKFLLVPYHLPDAVTLDSAILGGYVAHVQKLHPDAVLPAVYVDDDLLSDAREQRARLGDEDFIAELPTGDDEWGTPGWNPALLDAAFAAPPGDSERRRLVGDLLTGPFRRYARAVRGDAESYIPLDLGLSVISAHAKQVLGYDAVVLLLDELVLWLAGYLGDQVRVSREAQKVSKLVESAERERPAPIISFVPRQRDLRDLVGRDTPGAVVTSLFDTLKYWDGRFDRIPLDDRNLPAIVQERLLRPKDDAARAALDEAFGQTANVRSEVWETLLDVQGEKADRAAFRATYPFSPAFLHAMVDISGALQRERTALKLMQQLLVDYRDTLPVGQLMPIGAIFDVLAVGADRPFTDKLREEFEQAKRFYFNQIRPFLLERHGLTEQQAGELGPRHAFRADDLVAKTLLLAALVPNVPALRGLTASRLAALNHGSIVAMLPNQERRTVAKTLRDLARKFGEFRVSDDEDPRVDLALIGIDTDGILRQARYVDDSAARRREIRDLLWEEMDVTDSGELVTAIGIVWRGTTRRVELVFGNVRDEDSLPWRQFEPNEPGAIRIITDYPFDEGNHSPAEDANRVKRLPAQLDGVATLVWLPHFLSARRLDDLSDLIVISHVLRPGVLDDLTPNLTTEDRHHARLQLDSRRAALTARLRDAIKRAYGVASAEDEDLGARTDTHVLSLDTGVEPRPQVGQGLGTALRGLCYQLLDYRYPRHPDFDPQGRRQAVKAIELTTVLRAVEQGAQNPVGRHEPPQADRPVLKRIANPLGLGVMHEAAFVLQDDWKQLLDRKVAGRGEVTVTQLRGWVEDERSGLPQSVQDLVIACYAIQADRAWARPAGTVMAPPELAAIRPEFVLRSQEQPSQEEFDTASRRAEGIFGVARQPVRSNRASNAIARGVRQRAGDLLTAAEALTEALEMHARTLGLDDSSPRFATARALSGLLNQLAGTTESTALIRALAAAGLPRENAIYRAHLDNARTVTTGINATRWQVLDRLATVTDGENAAAAGTLLGELRSAARHDEHEVGLAETLRQVEQRATALFLDAAAKRSTVPSLDVAAEPEPKPENPELGPVVQVRRARGANVLHVVEEICTAADASPDDEFEITWRVVPR